MLTLHVAVASVLLCLPLTVAWVQEPAQSEERQQPAQTEEKQQEEPARQEREQARGPQREESSDVRNDRIQQAGGPIQKRVPDPEFREHFGREHHFRIAQPVVVTGYPRFQYGGFWFVIVDQWPAAWLYTDDFFIDFVDGSYYLCDVAHPDVLVLVSVV